MIMQSVLTTLGNEFKHMYSLHNSTTRWIKWFELYVLKKFNCGSPVLSNVCRQDNSNPIELSPKF